MKKNKISQYILVLICVASFATIGFTTYSAPTATAPNANTDGVLTTSTKTEVKNGDLKLNGAFYANSASYFAQDITILDQINGGLQTGLTKSIFTVGSGANPMNVLISGFLRTNNIQADNLKPVPGVAYQTMTRSNGSVVNKVCVDKTGGLYLCQNSVTIACGNNIVESAEQCDDGNTVDGDGCSSVCQTEVPTYGVGCSNNGITSGGTFSWSGPESGSRTFPDINGSATVYKPGIYTVSCAITCPSVLTVSCNGTPLSGSSTCDITDQIGPAPLPNSISVDLSCY